MMQLEDPGVCSAHVDMAGKITAMHTVICGDRYANPPIVGLGQQHDEMWAAHVEKKAEKKFVWRSVVGHILTAVLSAGSVLAVMLVKGILK